MFLSHSITVHLLRGLGAVVLILVAIALSSYGLFWAGMPLLGALFLLRGCPLCWTLGLFEAIKRR